MGPLRELIYCLVKLNIILLSNIKHHPFVEPRREQDGVVLMP